MILLMFLSNVAKVLLVRVWISEDNWVLIEHLPVSLLLRKSLKVCNLVLDLRLDFAELLRHLLLWQAASSSVIIHVPGLSLVLRNDMLAITLWAHNSKLEVVGTFVSVTSALYLLHFLSLGTSLSDALALYFVHLDRNGVVVGVFTGLRA